MMDDERMKSAVFSAMDTALCAWVCYEDEIALHDFMCQLKLQGYKIVKESE